MRQDLDICSDPESFTHWALIAPIRVEIPNDKILKTVEQLSMSDRVFSNDYRSTYEFKRGSICKQISNTSTKIRTRDLNICWKVSNKQRILNLLRSG